MLDIISPVPSTSTTATVQHVRKRSNQVASILNSPETIDIKRTKD